MSFDVLLLGTGAAVPERGRHPSCQVIHIGDHWFLLDCGEGAQERLNIAGVPKSKIDHIFISHLHGDHFFGLIGLLTTFMLSGREKALHLYAPEGLQAIVDIQLKYGGASLSYPIHYHVLDTSRHNCIYQDSFVEIHTLPLLHRIPCAGFLFREKPKPLNIRKEKIEEYQLTITQIKQAKLGLDITLDDGQVVPFQALTLAPIPPRAYAYCSDTAYHPPLVSLIKGVDLLFHEATFAEDMIDHAAKTGHSTARQAAEIARQAGVKTLLIGHFSPRYPDEAILAKEAASVFPNTLAGKEGQWYAV